MLIEINSNLARLDTMVTVLDINLFFQELNSLDSLVDRGLQSTVQDQRTISNLLIDQIEFSNVILLNKCDTVTDRSIIEKAEKIIKKLNPEAKIIKTSYGKVPLKEVKFCEISMNYVKFI